MRPYYPANYKQQIVDQVLAIEGQPVFKALPPATDPSVWEINTNPWSVGGHLNDPEIMEQFALE